MASELWVELLLLLSLIAGTVAVTLCLLTWGILRESAVGRTVVALTVVMALFSFYHGIALLIPQSELLISALKSVTFTAVALFIGLLIRFERTVVEDSRARGEP